MADCNHCHNKEYCAKTPFVCNECHKNGMDGFSPITNADKIRAMTNDELAWFIEEMQDCGSCAERFGSMPCSKTKSCHDVWSEWLAEEAE